MLVSAVITAYNAEKYIAETLKSVSAQTYSPMEIIVVDDGSTDRTAEIVRTQFPDVEYIYQPNGGQPSARNAGIRHAKGTYIAFLDSDDLWFSEKIARQVERLTQSQAVWCYCDCLFFYKDLQHALYRSSAQVRPRRGRILEPLLLGNFISSPTPIIRRDALIDVGLWDETVAIAEDWNMWLKLSARFGIEYVDETLAAYRLHPDSMMKASSIQNILDSNLAVLSNGLSQMGGDCRGIAEKARANIYFKIGLVYLKRGEEGMGRRMLFQALRNDPLQLRFYAYQLVSLLPAPFVKNANRLRHWFFRAARPVS